jgi:hypothetical protein
MRWRALADEDEAKDKSPNASALSLSALQWGRHSMADAAALRAEAIRLRALARGVTDEQALAAIHQMVEELESRALAADNGRAGASWYFNLH